MATGLKLHERRCERYKDSEYQLLGKPTKTKLATVGCENDDYTTHYGETIPGDNLCIVDPAEPIIQPRSERCRGLYGDLYEPPNRCLYTLLCL